MRDILERMSLFEAYVLEIDGKPYQDGSIEWQQTNGDPEEMLRFARQNLRGQAWSIINDFDGEILADWEGDGRMLDPDKSHRDRRSYSPGELERLDKETKQKELMKKLVDIDDAISYFGKKLADLPKMSYREAEDWASEKLQYAGHPPDKYDIEAILYRGGYNSENKSVLSDDIKTKIMSDMEMKIGEWASGMEEDPVDGMNRIFQKYGVGSGTFDYNGAGWTWWQSGGEEEFMKFIGSPNMGFYEYLSEIFDVIRADHLAGGGEWHGPDTDPWYSESYSNHGEKLTEGVDPADLAKELVKKVTDDDNVIPYTREKAVTIIMKILRQLVELPVEIKDKAAILAQRIIDDRFVRQDATFQESRQMNFFKELDESLRK